MHTVTLEQAFKIIGDALAEGRRLDLKPLTVAVLDAGGHLIALGREDGSSNLRPKVAAGKAGSALALGISSRAIGEMAEARPAFVNALAMMDGVDLVPAAGGVLVRSPDGILVGAVGVTGDTSDNDEACALAGIAGAGLTAGK